MIRGTGQLKRLPEAGGLPPCSDKAAAFQLAERSRVSSTLERAASGGPWLELACMLIIAPFCTSSLLPTALRLTTLLRLLAIQQPACNTIMQL